ncbi:MAG TPA: NUDIX domain-containing protein [Acetivibrio sp.]|nr:NUDIX hydrolase [Clostridium sp.]HOQ37684.1 NUDIX domain-containing protein [Acetivibrio sp.]HPT91632.1 NUDIX domain-containing protein [Acetivibrio sp.]HQA56490.1 NUDIX domain-containing protein [Acetivibrio sp.]
MSENILNKQGLTEEEFLSAYDASKYERPSVTVDMLVFTVTDEEKENYRKLPKKVLRLLMIKRGDHPFIGQWALPGGFVNMNESLDEAALRELKEETNIDNIYMEQLYTWGDVDRDPRTRVISASYMSLVDSSTLDIKASDDADDAKWFTVSCKMYQEQKTVTENGYVLQRWFRLTLSNDDDELYAIVKTEKTVDGKIARIKREVVESHGIAFDHAKVIQYGIERLRNKIEYTDIAFNLMPSRFTLTELQQVYEIILDTELLKANFRRKIADMVIETNEYTKDAGHRPSKLFKFNPDWDNVSG